jgi:5-methylcytosine-specific restriction protein B
LKPRGDNAEDYTVSYLRTQKLFEAYPDLNLVKNIDKEFRQVIGGSNSTAYWCVINNLNAWVNQKRSNNTLSVPVSHINEALIKFDNQIVKANKTANVKPFVLIIDEINRGNVSKIFGELITLIEQDKRLGHEEALEIVLPYSKEKFGVPANLFIVGTMNTADRSVEALDTALRRRFYFQEMMPDPELLTSNYLFYRMAQEHDMNWNNDDWSARNNEFYKTFKGEWLSDKREEEYFNLSTEQQKALTPTDILKFIRFEGLSLCNLLLTLNERIEILKDRDHQIGHAYFMHVYSIANLIAVFKNHIIPLLQEYFFGDYYKIQLVLGKGFINSISSTVQFAIEDDGEFEDKILYSINSKAFSTEEDFKSALSDMKINEK